MIRYGDWTVCGCWLVGWLVGKKTNEAPVEKCRVYGILVLLFVLAGFLSCYTAERVEGPNSYVFDGDNVMCVDNFIMNFQTCTISPKQNNHNKIFDDVFPDQGPRSCATADAAILLLL